MVGMMLKATLGYFHPYLADTPCAKNVLKIVDEDIVAVIDVNSRGHFSRASTGCARLVDLPIHSSDQLRSYYFSLGNEMEGR